MNASRLLHDDADRDRRPLPIELQRVLLNVLRESEAEGGEGNLNQAGIQVQIEAGEHGNDGGPDIVVGPS